MIEFKGTITNKEVIKRQAIKYKSVILICFVIAALFMLLLLGVYWIFRMILLCMMPIIIIAIIIIPNKYVAILPDKLFIDTDERTIVYQVKGSPETFKMLDDVTKVEDHGDYYAFCFNHRSAEMGFVAQKDLITKGTIEEFEEIFEEVLVRVK